jgi:hypothetical protein
MKSIANYTNFADQSCKLDLIISKTEI